MDGEQGGGWQRRGRHLSPFVAVVTFTYALALLPPAVSSPTLLAASLACFALAGLLVVVVPWTRLPAGAIAVPVVLVCLAIGLLRHSAGGSSSGYGNLFLLPVIWQALYGRRWELAGTLAAVAAAYVIPIALIGGADYPPSAWRSALLSTTIAATVGLVVEHLNRSRDLLLERARVLADHDELTGLVNRREASRVLDRLCRQGRGGTVAMLDLDHFKRFNDTHGHLAGDAALADSAEGWRQVVRRDDVISRWGGEEFVVVFPDSSLADAERVLGRMAASMPSGLTFSAGAVTIEVGDDPGDLLGAADLLLYRAKDEGRDRIVTARSIGPVPDLHRRRGRPVDERAGEPGRRSRSETDRVLLQP